MDRRRTGLISESYNLSEFFRSVKPTNTLELIYTAEQEATAAERALYHSQPNSGAPESGCREYVEALKSFISYLRCHIRPPVNEKWLPLFQHAEEALAQNRRSLFQGSAR
jgi:hypothetical protein